jgi:hypothetical protein
MFMQMDTSMAGAYHPFYCSAWMMCAAVGRMWEANGYPALAYTAFTLI